MTMTQAGIRQLFPNYTVEFNHGNSAVCLYTKGRDKRLYAVVTRFDDKVDVRMAPRGAARKNPAFCAVAEVSSFQNVQQVITQMDVTNAQFGKRPCTYGEATRYFADARAADFESALSVLCAMINFEDDHGPVITHAQMRLLTKAGKARWRRVQNSKPEAAVAACEGPESVVGAACGARSVWSTEDDEIMALVMEEHKKLSNRVAQLHSARGSKISIQEFDRRLAAAGKPAPYKSKATLRVEWINEPNRHCSVKVDHNRDGSYKCHRVTWYLQDAGWLSAEGNTWGQAIDNAMATVFNHKTGEYGVGIKDGE